MSFDDPLLPLAREAAKAFAGRFDRPSAQVAVAPGRVNLIGDHTDYNEGFVLPMGLDRGVACAFAPRGDGRLCVHSLAHGETGEADIGSLRPPPPSGFFAYVAGVAWAFREAGLAPRGLDALVLGSLPIGSGLSSSAALQLAFARALAAASGTAWEPVAMARLSQHSENAYVGLSCGLMDQYSAAAAQPGAALLLDCRSLQARPVPLPEEVSVAILDTGVRRSLTGSAYNERRAACDRAVHALAALRPGVRSLRDVDDALLQAGRGLMDDVTWKRAAHVVAENARPPAFADALAAGDLEAAGRLMDDSHASLRDLYEVSSPELDALTALARLQPGCLGARLTGAGFGGCAVALVRRSAAEGFADALASAWKRERPDLASGVFACRPGGGARLLG